MAPGIMAWAEARGYRVACGDTAVLDRVRAEYEAHKTAGEVDEGVVHYLRDLTYGASAGFKPETVLLIALPRPGHRLLFELPTGQAEAVVPPTYLDYRATARRVLEELREVGGMAQLELLDAPLKAVAAGLGLVTYGRNNIAYHPDFGSYLQLVGLITDVELDLPYHEAGPPVQSPACRDCRACLKACPTGAISKDRFLLSAGRCLTLYNEEAGGWPDWLPTGVHRNLVGCLACQMACPQNAGKLRLEDKACFDAVETAALLEGDGELAEALAAKFHELGLLGYDAVVRRNLKALFAG